MFRLGPAILGLILLCSCSQKNAPSPAASARGVADGGGTGVKAASCTVKTNDSAFAGANIAISSRDAEIPLSSTNFQAAIYAPPDANGGSSIILWAGVNKLTPAGPNQTSAFQSEDPSQFRLIISNVEVSDGVYSSVLEHATLTDGSQIISLPLDCEVP